jgi:hypothetical protein
VISACDPAAPPPAIPAWFCRMAAREECVPARYRYLWPELAALIATESGWLVHALRDETEGRQVTEVRNVAQGRAYIAKKPTHKFGIGLTQITGDNLQRWFGEDWRNKAWDACENMRAGLMHFVTDNLPVARARYNGSGEAAARHAMRVKGRLDQITGSFVAVQQPMRPTAIASPDCGTRPPSWAAWQSAQYRACINAGR